MKIEISIDAYDRDDALALLDGILNRKLFVSASEIARADGDPPEAPKRDERKTIA